MRCVGGPLDNVDIAYRGQFITVTAAELGEEPEDPPRMHTYVYSNGVYVHNEDCCPVKAYEDWLYEKTGKEPMEFATPSEEN